MLMMVTSLVSVWKKQLQCPPTHHQAPAVPAFFDVSTPFISISGLCNLSSSRASVSQLSLGTFFMSCDATFKLVYPPP